jgi:DNA-binding transcriptional LysR family regulator
MSCYHSAILQNEACMFDWNDLRYFLAVARIGSTLGAAKELRVSQTTVARRIAALERALGLLLFEKRQAGYALTPAGQELVAQAERVELAAAGFHDATAAHSRDLHGTVKISMEEIFATTLFAPLLREFRDLHPEIRIELDTTSGLRDLGAGEADIALRSTSGPQPAGIVGRVLGDDDWAFYCSPGYADRYGVPASLPDLRKHALVGGGGGALWRHYQAFLQRLDLEDRVAMHYDSSPGLMSAVRAGVGIAVLPCVVADADPDFIRCLPPRPGHGRVMWLITHERVRNEPRVRATIDFIYDRLSRHIRRLQAREAA